MTQPLVHLFHLGVAQENLGLFYQAGMYNLTTSYENEIGTLAMYVSSIKGKPTEFVVFEVYADETAYQTHRDSSQYQAYIQQVGNQLTKRASYEVEALFLEEKQDFEILIRPEQYFFKFSQIEVKSGEQSAFETSFMTNMKLSMREETDVLAMYAMKNTHTPTLYYFYEVYANAIAYENHRNTKHFQTYINETQDILSEKILLDLENSIAISRGTLTFSE